MLTLAIIATIMCFLSFIGASIRSAKDNPNNTDKVALHVVMVLLNKAFLVTVIWIFYSNIK